MHSTNAVRLDWWSKRTAHVRVATAMFNMWNGHNKAANLFSDTDMTECFGTHPAMFSHSSHTLVPCVHIISLY